MAHQRTLDTARDEASPEFDNPSDCCDFGYVLMDSGVLLRKNDVGQEHRKQKSVRDGQFDPLHHWGQA